MVYTETFKILDCGVKKYTPEINMTKLGLDLYNKYKMEEHELEVFGSEFEEQRQIYQQWNKEYEIYLRKNEFHDEKNIYCTCGGCYPPVQPKLKDVQRDTYEKFKNWNWLGGQRYTRTMDPMLFEHFGIKPFEPWVMINISPDWAGKKIEKQNICKFKNIFKKYMAEGWYSEWKYVLEAGGNGDFLHLHALCKMGSDIKKLKSTRTHIGKSNWKNQIMKYAKAEGLEGRFKKPGMQVTTIQGECGQEILNDKLDYLIEEKKTGRTQKQDPQGP